MESYEMDIVASSSLTKQSGDASQTMVNKSTDDPYGFRIMMQRALETAYNLTGNSQYTAKVSVDQKKKKISAVIQFTSESENLKTRINFPLLWDFDKEHIVIGMTELTPVIFPEYFSNKEYRDKNIRFDVSETNDNDDEENSDIRQEMLKELNKIISVMPEKMLSEIPLDTKDRSVSGHRKIRMTMTIEQMAALAESIPTTYSESDSYNSGDLVNEDAEEKSSLSDTEKESLGPLLTQPFSVDYTFNQKNQLVRIYSHASSAFNHSMLLSSIGFASDHELNAVYDISVRFKKRPSLPFDPAEKEIIDYDDHKNKASASEEVAATEAVEADSVEEAVEAVPAEAEETPVAE